MNLNRTRNRQRADRYHSIGVPKSDAGQRTVPVPPIVVNALKEWKLTCPHRSKTESDPGELHFVFPNGKGHIEWHGNIINRRVDGGLELLPKMVQERMGHSSIAMTMGVYGHLFPSTDDVGALAAAERELLAVNPVRLRQRCDNRRTPLLIEQNCIRNSMAGGPGFEPGLAESESAVLPLNYPPAGGRKGGLLTCSLRLV